VKYNSLNNKNDNNLFLPEENSLVLLGIITPKIESADSQDAAAREMLDARSELEAATRSAAILGEALTRLQVTFSCI
jgi:hypothetical protein